MTGKRPVKIREIRFNPILEEVRIRKQAMQGTGQGTGRPGAFDGVPLNYQVPACLHKHRVSCKVFVCTNIKYEEPD